MDDAVSAETVNDRELAKRAYIARLTLLDDLFMGLVFEDRRCIELVLRIILGIDDLCVEENQVKHTMANLVGRSAQICPDDGTPLGDLAHDFRCADPARMRYNVLKRKASVLKDGEEAPIMSESIDRLVEEFKGFWIEDGLAEGRQRGLEEGLAQGREEGLERGRREGLERGRLEGLEAGRQQGLEEAARGLLRQGSFSPDDIAGLTGLPVERVRELASLL